jgi:hypothetical protein
MIEWAKFESALKERLSVDDAGLAALRYILGWFFFSFGGEGCLLFRHHYSVLSLLAHAPNRQFRYRRSLTSKME